ncbi:cupredoxin domain-containing protein [Azospirillum sp.]|uniref:cupredoxin domain-containing protein n=1 Tax=Azospirillum sp. TaxID=34012 RepID=UPI003D73AB59
MIPMSRLTGAALAILLGPVLPLTAVGAEPVQVRIDNFTFTPPAITVSKGTTVTWLNADDIPHKIAGNDRPWKSPVLDTDERFSFTFTEPGRYAYFCSLHPHMTGTVTVTDQ